MLKKYPFVKQTGLKDCGVACLQMIIKYYQGYISIRQLQEMTKTTKNGTTAYHLIEALNQIGFSAKGFKATIDDINKQNMILPCIANVTIDNTYNHYIVIYEIDYKNKKLTIADPAEKIKKISYIEFSQIWNNVFLFMYPIKKIPLYTKEQKALKFLISSLSINKKLITSIIFLSIAYAFYSVTSSYYFKFIGDGLILTSSKSYLIIIFIVFTSFTFFKLLSDFFRNQLLVYLNEKTELILTNSIFKSIILLPYNYYRNHTTGEITSRINDLGKVREMISKVIIFVFVDLPLALLSCVLLFLISKDLFFITLIIFFLYVLLSLIFIPIFSRHIDKVQQQKAEYNSYMVESISGFESVKGIGIENLVMNKFEGKFIQFLNGIFNFDILYNIQNFIKEFICDIGSIVIIFIGSLLIAEEKMSLGSLLFFNSLLSYFLLPFKNILEFGILFKEAHISLKRVFEIVEANSLEGNITKNIDGVIEFKNLNYSYDDRSYVLKKINLKIEPREKIMIIGDSGSGKSTLMKLMLRYYKCNRNQIMLDNIDINDYKVESLKKDIVYLSQNETLFTDTLYNNIDLENTNNYEKFTELAKMCYVDEIVKDKNVGYNFLLEENGFNLSGGERQRIILARALMRDFKILIVDEGLNQVDISLERKILKNILSKYHDKTIIFISHRMENMDLFNRLIEFSNHKIKKDVCKSV